MQDTKQRLRQLIDELPESELHAAERFLQFLGNEGHDPFLAAMQRAPIGDDPVTPEEEALIQEGLDDLAAGRVVSHEEVRRRILGRA